MLAASPRHSSNPPVQNLVVVVVTGRQFIFLAERAAQVGIENVVAGRGVDGAARVGTNDDVNIFRFFNQRRVVAAVCCLLVKAKESEIKLKKLFKTSSRWCRSRQSPLKTTPSTLRLFNNDARAEFLD